MTGKVWGTSALIESSPLFEMSWLEIKPRHECSLHVHRHKANGFLVIKGKLFILVVKNDYALEDVTELKAGDHMVVAAGEHHKFFTGGEGCVAIEWYTPMPLSTDIERKGHGGPIRRGKRA